MKNLSNVQELDFEWVWCNKYINDCINYLLGHNYIYKSQTCKGFLIHIYSETTFQPRLKNHNRFSGKDFIKF